MNTNRRDFALTSAGVLLGLAVGQRGQGGVHDLVVRRGTLFDGTGSAGVEGDIAIAGGRIVEISRTVRGRGRDELDARGLAVAPGFVDLHSHGDGGLQEDPRGESLIRQGITTIVVGQDGSSRAVSSAERRAPGGQPDTFAALFASIDGQRPAVNVASMIGLGTVRGRVVGNTDRPATPDELRTMVGMVESALAEGACGASSGLEYTPGAFASTEELIALCRPLAARGLPYATHMRNEDVRLFEAVDDEGRPIPAHHPFTMPHPDDADLLAKGRGEELLGVRSLAYDLVLNGWELGSGSVRIADPDTQQQVFELLGIDEATARQRFGFLLDAFRYGAPPHAGFAFGIDRLVAILAGEENIREVIAFPKTQSGSDPLTGAPTEIEATQLRELGLSVTKPKK